LFLSGANASLLRQLGHVKKTIFVLLCPNYGGSRVLVYDSTGPQIFRRYPQFILCNLALYILALCDARRKPDSHLERLGGLRVLPISFVVVIVLLNAKLIGLRSSKLYGWLPISPSAIQEHRTDHGALIYTGVKDSQCWNAQLPCAARV
jgi:hypothetical protein